MKTKKIIVTISFILFGLNMFAQNIEWLKAKTIIGNNATKQTNFDQSGHIFTIVFKPKKVVNSLWNTSSNTWVYNDSTLNAYNNSGNITQKLVYGFAPYPSEKTYYTYNGNGKIIADTSVNWNGIYYDTNAVNTYTYDVNGNLIQQLMYSAWNGFDWNSIGKSEYSYDVNNNQTQFLIQDWDGSGWINTYKINDTWIGGLLVESTINTWDGVSWVFEQKADLTYVSGQLKSYIIYIWNGSTWDNFQKITDMVWYEWNGVYSPNSKMLSSIEHEPNGSLWSDIRTFNITYDPFGNQTDYVQQTKQGSIYVTTDEYKNIYQYNGNNSIIEDIQQVWNSGIQNVENSTKKEYSNFYQYSDSACAPDQPGIIIGNTTVNPSTSETYSVTPVIGATSYNWTLPSGWTGSSTSNSIVVNVGITSGVITVSAANGCGTSTSSNLTVNQADSSTNTQDWVWAKSTGIEYQGYAMDIATDALGNSYITGTFASSTITFGTITLNKVSAYSGYDVYIAKYDANGNALWAKNASILTYAPGSSIAIATDANNNVFISGEFNVASATFGGVTLNHTASANNGEIFIVKYDSQGNLLWAKEVDYTGDIWMYDIATDSQGNALITGSFGSTYPLTIGSTTLAPHSNTNPFVAKFDSSGNPLWAKGAESANSPANWSYGVATDANDNVFITGEYVSSTSSPFTFGMYTLPPTTTWGRSMYIVKFDSSGNALWAKASTSPTSSGSYAAVGFHVTTDVSGNAIVTGSFKKSTVNFGSIVLTNSNTTSNFVADIFIVKYDSSGNELWAKKGGGTADDEGHKISCDTYGNTYVSGYFESKPASFGSFTINKQNSYSKLFFVIKYDNLGNEVWVKYTEQTESYGGGLMPNSVSSDDFGNVYVTGNAMDSDPYNGSAVFGNTTLTYGGVFIAKLGETPIGVKENLIKNSFLIYPNPSNDYITIENKSTLLNSTYLIFNSLGQQVLIGKLIGENTTVDITKLSTGLYFLQVGEDEKQTFKLMKK